MNRKPEVGEYIEVRFDYPRKSKYDYIGYVTRHRFSDDTVEVKIVQGDSAKIGKTKHIDWLSQAVIETDDTPTEEDLKELIDLALLLEDERMFKEATRDLLKLQNNKVE
jgi:hypothetical protein